MATPAVSATLTFATAGLGMIAATANAQAKTPRTTNAARNLDCPTCVPRRHAPGVRTNRVSHGSIKVARYQLEVNLHITSVRWHTIHVRRGHGHVSPAVTIEVGDDNTSLIPEWR